MLHEAKRAFTIAPKMFRSKDNLPNSRMVQTNKGLHMRRLCVLSHDVTIEILIKKPAPRRTIQL